MIFNGTLAREDIELAFIRIFSVNGCVLQSASMTAHDRRERIRIALMQHGMKDEPFDTGRSFGRAFEDCYQMAAEQRRLVRGAHDRPPGVVDAIQSLEDDEDEDDLAVG